MQAVVSLVHPAQCSLGRALRHQDTQPVATDCPLDGPPPSQLLGLDLHQFGDERKGRFIDAKRLRQITSKSMKMGSSRFPGEGGLDFQKEVFRVPKSIG
ncbi:hypothetical protein, partial [Pseudomonas aeruginosa]|uniref:hypothetical protein n=1 Tax=Pseudomonas aeruginosa TaxID=287 RepID=UPI002012DAD0